MRLISVWGDLSTAFRLGPAQAGSCGRCLLSFETRWTAFPSIAFITLESTPSIAFYDHLWKINSGSRTKCLSACVVPLHNFGINSGCSRTKCLSAHEPVWLARLASSRTSSMAAAARPRRRWPRPTRQSGEAAVGSG